MQALCTSTMCRPRPCSSWRSAAPVSLLDQEVINASGAGITIGIPMRCLFALTAMGFVDANGVVRVRTFRSWLRIDAPFGSVYYRRQLLRLV
jgi:hypothetical protein